MATGSVENSSGSVAQADVLDLAVQRYSTGDFAGAQALCQRLLKDEPEHFVALHLLGVVALETGEAAAAIAHLGKAASLDPENSEIHNNLGAAYERAGAFDQALASYQKAVSCRPDFPEAHNNIGNVLQHLGYVEQAIDSYQSAIDLRPDYANAHFNLGATLQELGFLDKAADSYRSALAGDPGHAEAHRHLSHVQSFDGYSDEIKAMERLFAGDSTDDDQKMHLGFALGKAFEDLGQHHKAFRFFEAGNKLKRSRRDYSGDATRQVFARIKTCFPGPVENPETAETKPNQTPIFIVGMMRSGTSLVEQILASHPLVFGGGELAFLQQAVTGQLGGLDKPDFVRRCEQASEQDLREMARHYTDSIRSLAGEVPFVTDKMPSNFLFIGWLKKILPQAKIIHCRRNPVDTCLSIYKNYFTADDHHYAYDLGELGQYYNLYKDLMEHWEQVCPGSLFHIQYETLVTDQEAQTRALLDHCGLDWNDACLQFYNSSHPVRTASSVQVRKPIYTGSVQLWKKYETHLAPLLDALDEGPAGR